MILIVEDEPVSRRALAALLGVSGYATAAVPTAEEALVLLEHGVTPEIALIDVDLPGMSGFDLIQQLQESNPTVQPVIISAASRERINEFRDKHPVTYLRKPVNVDELLSLLSDNQRPN